MEFSFQIKSKSPGDGIAANQNSSLFTRERLKKTQQIGKVRGDEEPLFRGELNNTRISYFCPKNIFGPLSLIYPPPK
jgi:hypothetical protein